MKIAVVHNLEMGGAHRRLRSQIQGLAGHEILEVTLSTGKPVTETAVVVPLRQLADSKSRWMRPPLRYVDLALLHKAWRRAAGVVNAWQPDLCFANPCQFLTAPSLVNRLEKPVVFYCDEPRRAYHDDSIGDTFNDSTKSLYYLLRSAERFSERKNTLAADRVATNSRYTAALIRDALGVDSQLVRCGVAESFSAGDDVGAAAAFKHVLSVGTLIPSKGHDLVIEAMALSRVELPLVVVSPREGECQEQARLRQLADECGVRLKLMAGIPEVDLRDLYRSAFATLYLAQGEPFGLASIEAQACGSPVIVASEGGLPETLVDGGTGWCVARDPKSAARALDDLLDPDVRLAMVGQAPEWAAGFTWAKSVESLEAVFASVA